MADGLTHFHFWTLAGLTSGWNTGTEYALQFHIESECSYKTGTAVEILFFSFHLIIACKNGLEPKQYQKSKCKYHPSAPNTVNNKVKCCQCLLFNLFENNSNISLSAASDS